MASLAMYDFWIQHDNQKVYFIGFTATEFIPLSDGMQSFLGISTPA